MHVNTHCQAFESAHAVMPNLPAELASCFSRDKAGNVVWYPTPPINPVQKEAPVHSADYILWKENLQSVSR